MTAKKLLSEFHFSVPVLVSLISQLYHFLAFSLEKPKMQLESSMLIMSVDVDVGSKELGVINKGKNDANINACVRARKRIGEYSVGEIEERAVPLFVDLFNDFEIPGTFAIRGQLIEVDDLILNLLRKSPVKHDIGAHGYYHRHFKNLSHSEAENELKLISIGMKKFSITPRSFVFPNNSVSHLDLLEKYGYKCYRSYGDFMNDCMYIERKGQLYDIHPSLYLCQNTSSTFLRKMFDIAIEKKLPFHIWFHPWNLGQDVRDIQRNINKIFVPLFDYGKRKEKIGMLTFETMLSAANKVEKAFGPVE